MYRRLKLAVLFAIWICASADTHYVTRRESNPRQTLKQIKTPTVPQYIRPDFSAAYEADRHYRTMLTKSKCKDPRPVVVNVKEEYHMSTVDYLPHCTILHRCDTQAGCCGKGHQCIWATRVYVDLYFYAIPLRTNHSQSEIIKLTFTNHTACACKEDAAINEVNLEQTTETPWEQDDSRDVYYDGLFGCKKCPRPFAERVIDESRCFCDCFEGDRECIEIKKGHRSLSSEGASCVRHEECLLPSCYTGTFDVSRGACARVCQPGTVFDHRKKRCVRKYHRHKHRYGQRRAAS